MYRTRRLTLVAIVVISLAGLSTGCQQRASRVQADPAASKTDTSPSNTEVVTEYWPDGQLKLRKQVSRRDDNTVVNHGLYECWHNSGKPRYRATYVDGKLDGVETAWHQNGQKRTEQHYQHGLRNGPRYSWDEQGRLRKEENYQDDKPHGTWTIWKEDGTIKWRAEYDSGRPRR